MYIITDKNLCDSKSLAGEFLRLDLLQARKIEIRDVRYSTDSIRGIDLSGCIIDINNKELKDEVRIMLHISARFNYMKDNNLSWFNSTS